MPRTVDLFLDSDQPLDLLARELGGLVGAQLRQCPDRNRYVLQAGEVTAYLAEHDFLDDDGLPLSEFRYVLSAQVPGPGDIGQSPPAQFLRRVNSAWRQATGLASLLVIDLDWPDAAQVVAEGAGAPGADDQGAAPPEGGHGPTVPQAVSSQASS